MSRRRISALALGAAVVAGAACGESPTVPQPAELRKEEIRGAPCAPDGITSANGQLVCVDGRWWGGDG